MSIRSSLRRFWNIGDEALGAVLGFLTALCTAVYLLCFRAADDERLTVTFAILLWAAIFNSMAMAFRWKSIPQFSRSLRRSVLFLAGMTLVGNVALGKTLGDLGPGTTGTMMQLQVFFVALGAWLFLREKMDGILIVGSLLAVVGVLVLAAPSEVSETMSLYGLVSGIITAISFSAMMVWTRAVIRDLDGVALNAGRLWLAVLAMALWPGLVTKLLAMSPRNWAFAIAAAAMGPFGGRLLVMYSLRFITAAKTKLWGMLTPVFAFVFMYFAYGVVPGIREVLGGSLIVGGVLLPAISLLRFQNEARKKSV